MSGTVEREIKLTFASADAARSAVLGIGAVPLHGRRLQQDALLDTPGESLRAKRSVLRVRMEAGRAFLTFKGPVQPSLMKLREELETPVGDGAMLFRILDGLGFHVWFRYEKYREEFSHPGVILAVDETPVGVFVEIEGTDAGITRAAEALGRAPADYVLDSYRGLYMQDCERRGVAAADMLFSET